MPTPATSGTSRICPTKTVRAACVAMQHGTMTCSAYGSWQIRAQGNGLCDNSDVFWINIGSWKWAARHANVAMPESSIIMAVTPSELTCAGIIVRANLHGEGLSHSSLIGITMAGDVTDDLRNVTIAVARNNQVFVKDRPSDVPNNAAIGFMACTDDSMLRVLKTTGALINMGQRRMTKLPGR